MTNNKNLLNKTYNFTSYAYDEIKKKKGQTVFEKADRELLIRENNSEFDKYHNFYMFDFVVVGKSGKEATYKYDDKKICFYKYAGGDFNQYVVFANEEDKNDFLQTMNILIENYNKKQEEMKANAIIEREKMKENLKDGITINFNLCLNQCDLHIEDWKIAFMKAMREDISKYFEDKDIDIKAIPYTDFYKIENLSKAKLIEIVKDGEAVIKARENKKQAKKEAEEKAIADAIQKAKETGKAQIINAWNEDCNDDNLDCDCDNILEYIDENGKRWTERVHSY